MKHDVDAAMMLCDDDDDPPYFAVVEVVEVGVESGTMSLGVVVEIGIASETLLRFFSFVIFFAERGEGEEARGWEGKGA